MPSPTAVSLRGAAPVFVVKDVLRSVDHYRDVLGFRTEFTWGEPTCYQELKSRGARILHEPKDCPYGMRDFDVLDLDGNQLTFGMESTPTPP
jgi:hypothetical protein